jgi:serine protease Do
MAEVAERVKPSVVSIIVKAEVINFWGVWPQEGAGSGVILDKNGYIVTNYHVTENAKSMKVTLCDGRSLDAKLVGTDPLTDLAVIKIDASGLPPASFGGCDELRVADWVLAIGNALALEGGPTVTFGVVGNKGRSIQLPNGVILHDLIQTDAAINPGNSGGALVNMAGQVVGINNAKAAGAENIGFAISSNTVASVVQDLVNHGRVVRPWLGVEPRTITPYIATIYDLSTEEGVLVVTVMEDGPAEKAGLRKGDIITGFAGKEITSADELREAIHSHRIGDVVKIDFLRSGESHTSAVTLSESP